MRFNHLLVFLALTGGFLGGCFQQQVQEADLCPTVTRMLASRSDAQWGMLSSYQSISAGSELFIIGSETQCASLASRLLLSDDYDNVDGTMNPDRLPDFAGERIAMVVDAALSRSPEMSDSAAVMEFRDRSVKVFLAALDTLYCADRFGFERNAAKPRAKIVLIPSDAVSELSKADIDTLMKVSGAGVKIISSSEVLSSAMRQRFGDNAVALELDTIPAGVTPLRALLQAYSAAGEVKPVSAVVVRNFSVPPVDIMKECTQIRRGETWDDFELSKLIAERFEVLDPVELTVRECFRTLRSENLFTHDIAYPVSHSYQVVSNGSDPILKKNVQN